MNIRRLIFFALLLCLSVSGIATAQGTRLLRHPTVSNDSVAFEYAGDLWVVGRGGGPARRLTSTQGVELDPYFSPDGSQIAFTSTVAGNTDIYVVPTAGGDPRRLTYHPATDRVPKKRSRDGHHVSTLGRDRWRDDKLAALDRRRRLAPHRCLCFRQP